MLYYIANLRLKGIFMEILYVAIGVVIGVVIAIVLDVDSLSNLWAKKEKELDDKIEHEEERK